MAVAHLPAEKTATANLIMARRHGAKQDAIMSFRVAAVAAATHISISTACRKYGTATTYIWHGCDSVADVIVA